MHDAMFGVGSSPDPNIRVIKGLSDIIEPKRSKPAAANTVIKDATQSSQSVHRSNSPHKMAPKGSMDVAKGPLSPHASSVNRGQQPADKRSFANRSMQPFAINSNENASGLNTLLKSPMKNTLLPVPIKTNQLSGSAKTTNSVLNMKQVVMGENPNTMFVIPSAFV